MKRKSTSLKCAVDKVVDEKSKEILAKMKLTLGEYSTLGQSTELDKAMEVEQDKADEVVEARVEMVLTTSHPTTVLI